MSDGFLVDMGALERASAGVNGTLDQVGEQPVSGLTITDSAIGHGQLASTLAEFRGRWQLGLQNLSQDGREIATRLTVSVAVYRKAEQNILNTLSGGVLSGSGSDPGAS